MKKTISIFASLLWLILFSQSIVFSQVENNDIQWTKIESPEGSLTFSVPPGFLIDNESLSPRLIAYQDNVTINVNIERIGAAQDRIKQMRQFPAPKESKISQFTLGKFIGDVYTFEKEGVFSISIYAASSKELYTVSVAARDSTNSVVMNFLNSIKLGDSPLLKQKTQSDLKEEAIVSIDSLKTSPAILEALKRKDAKKIKIKYDLNSAKSFNDDKIREDSTKYSRSLIILRKPGANYSDSGRNNGVSGVVRIRVLFQANGEIGGITILNKLERGLDENAANAVRKIKFLPAEIDGKPVDAFRVIEYSFTIY